MLEFSLLLDDGIVEGPRKDNTIPVPIGEDGTLLFINTSDSYCYLGVYWRNGGEKNVSTVIRPKHIFTMDIVHFTESDFLSFSYFHIKSSGRLTKAIVTDACDEIIESSVHKKYELKGFRIRHGKHCGRFMDETPEIKTEGCRECYPELKDRVIPYPIQPLTQIGRGY